MMDIVNGVTSDSTNFNNWMALTSHTITRNCSFNIASTFIGALTGNADSATYRCRYGYGKCCYCN